MKNADVLIPEARRWARAEHPHALHLERTLAWLDAIAPVATPAMRLAALLHDIERADPDPEAPFDSARDWHREAYTSYHQGRCAAHLTRWLGAREAAPDVVTESVALVAVHEIGGWQAANLIQAADSLSFIETMTPLLVDWVSSGQTSREHALAKLDHMWERMQVGQDVAGGESIWQEARGSLLG